MKPDSSAILILHHAPPAGQEWRESDAGVLVEAATVSAALDALGLAHRTVGVSRLADVPPVLAAAREDVIFNLVEDFAGASADANHVPMLCRAFGKGCTGSDLACLAAALDKWQTKALLQAAGLPCPRGIIVRLGEKVRAADLPPGPYIVKPVSADASEGIDGASVVRKRKGSRTLNLGVLDPFLLAVRRVHAEFHQSALVEQFIAGRELNVALIERSGAVEVLPIAEIVFSTFPAGRPRIVDYAAKWLPESFEYRNTPQVVPARLAARQAGAVRRLALAAWKTLGCRDYARVDFRLDGKGRPFILEVNPNADVSPDSGFAAALGAAGISFAQFVASLLENARARMNRKSAALRPCSGRGEQGRPPASSPARQARRPSAPQPRGPVPIRRSEPRDRDAILSLVAETGFFRPDELAVAQEVLDEALAKGPGGHYESFIAEDGGKPVGWVCFGPTPCTLGTFDIYWIAVALSHQRRGLGAALMRHAEDLISSRDGRMAVVETSGRPIYDPTRRFYARLGYKEAARIADFYAPGDDKIVYTKPLAS
jgi:D-alanine-D-alanine ligase